MKTIFVIIGFLVVARVIVNAQNVGIGTEDPESPLHVVGEVRSDSLILTAGAAGASAFLVESGASRVQQVMHNGYSLSHGGGWQSFTAPADGNAISVSIYFLDTPLISQLKLYAGEGIDGTELSSVEDSFAEIGWHSFPQFNLPVDSGSVYTIWMDKMYGIALMGGNPYEEGVYGNSNAQDMRFRITIAESIPFMIRSDAPQAVTLRNPGSSIEVSGAIHGHTAHMENGIGIGVSTVDYPVTIGLKLSAGSKLMVFKNTLGTPMWKWDMISNDLRLASETLSSVLNVKQNGNIGIGTPYPAFRLDTRVIGINSTVAQFSTEGGWADILIKNQVQQLKAGVDDDGGYIKTHTAHDLRLQTGGEDRVFIDHETGHVGIGTVNPTNRFYALDTSTAPTIIGTFEGYGNTAKHIRIGNASKNLMLGVHLTAGYIGTITPTDFVIRTGDSDRLFVDYESAHVGIGTVTPEYRCDVQLAATNAVVARFKTYGGFGEIHAGNTAHTASLGANDQGCYIGTFSESDLRVRTNNYVRLIVKHSNGFIGLGIDDPAARLDVNGNIKLSGLIENEAVIAPLLDYGWINYGEGFESAGYYKDKEGVVHLHGLIKSGYAQHITTLPVGYRPAATHLFTVISGSGFARIDVKADGTVTLVGSYNSAYVSLSGITFRT